MSDDDVPGGDARDHPHGPGAGRSEDAAPPEDLLSALSELLGRFGHAAGQVPGVSTLVNQVPDMPRMPWPGALSAAEVEAILEGIRAQQAHLVAVRASLDAFEQQLEVLARLLVPLRALTDGWAEVESRLTGPAGGPDDARGSARPDAAG